MTHTMRATFSQRLHHKKVARFVAAIAGLVGAVSILIGLAAARFGPHGWSRLVVFLHLHRQPFIVRFAAGVAAIAAVTAALAGIFTFYSWYRETHEEGASES